jgi:hypothetical protein
MPAAARGLAAPLAQISQQPRSAQYEPRRPENTLLHRVVRNHLASFLEQAAQVPEPGVPRFVDKELQAYLRCGVLALGFCRLQCGGCSYERLVPSSCKGRGFCPSCGGKRMTDLALHLTEHVIPYVPVRQFGLSIPHRLRYLRLRPCPLRRRARIVVRALFGSTGDARQRARLSTAGPAR